MRQVLCSLLMGAVLITVSLAQDSAQGAASASQGTSAPAQQPATHAQSQTSAQHNANQPGPQVQPGSIIYAELNKSVDAKKAKQGDEVVAKTSQAVLSQGKVVIPKGSKLVGHVTQVKAHTKEQQQSELGIAFDHAVLKDGTQVPIAVTIQAIGASLVASSPAMDADSGGGMAGPSGGGRPGYGSGSGGTMGPSRSTANTVGNTAGNTVGTIGDTAGGVAGTGQTASSGH